MKIKPDDIEIPHDDPFRLDLLDRKSTILTLTNLLQNLDAPYTMSIDASWGNGKTTFLNMWKQHLRNEGFPVVSFNAWETDFTGSPLVALTSELIEALESYGEEFDLELDALVRKIQTLLNKLGPTGVVGLVYLLNYLSNIQFDASLLSAVATGAMAGLGAATSAVALNDEPQAEPQEPNTYMDAKSTIDDFKSELQYVAHALSSSHDNKPLIIAIDELDRCRPSYAVELLEIAKHLFSVDNIVFVLAIEKSQLSHAIKAIYGSGFNAIGYLRRFIDLDFRLPDPDRTNFVVQLMASTKLLDNLEKHNIRHTGSAYETRSLLSKFLSLSALSLRQTQQTVHRFGLVMSIVDKRYGTPFSAITAMLILRTIDATSYYSFIRSGMTDKEVADYIFGLPWLHEFRWTREAGLFEALLIIAYTEFGTRSESQPKPFMSPLHHHYEEISLESTLAARHGNHVLKILEQHKGWIENSERSQSHDFAIAIDYIELLYDILPGT